MIDRPQDRPDPKDAESLGRIANDTREDPPTLPIKVPRIENDFEAWTSRHGDRIGPYTLLSVLGRGGFGIVFLAERNKPHRQRVAIKCLHTDPGQEEIVARFEAERQALAILNHPNIAAIYDAGTTDHGQLYYVMEYVAGRPINEWCDMRRAPIARRLELFASACDALDHAHRQGLVHRDVTPRNILVTDLEGTPTVKVIDFGIVKALRMQLTDKPIVTAVGRFLGTPEYMSPEQMRGDPDIDARSDVYSLGVVLYELLTGSLPLNGPAIRADPYVKGRRIVEEDEPVRPSTCITQDEATAKAIANRRKTDPDRLIRLLRDELEWIPLTALRKDPEQRYNTAGAMATDARRYLAGQTLVAGPDSIAYRARRSWNRYRDDLYSAVGAVIMAGLVALLFRQQWLLLLAGVMARFKIHKLVDLLPRKFENIVEAIAVGPVLIFIASPVLLSVWALASFVDRIKGRTPRRVALGTAPRSVFVPSVMSRLLHPLIVIWHEAERNPCTKGDWTLLHFWALLVGGRKLRPKEILRLKRWSVTTAVVWIVAIIPAFIFLPDIYSDNSQMIMRVFSPLVLVLIAVFLYSIRLPWSRRLLLLVTVIASGTVLIAIFIGFIALVYFFKSNLM